MTNASFHLALKLSDYSLGTCAQLRLLGRSSYTDVVSFDNQAATLDTNHLRASTHIGSPLCPHQRTPAGQLLCQNFEQIGQFNSCPSGMPPPTALATTDALPLEDVLRERFYWLVFHVFPWHLQPRSSWAPACIFGREGKIRASRCVVLCHVHPTWLDDCRADYKHGVFATTHDPHHRQCTPPHTAFTGHTNSNM